MEPLLPAVTRIVTTIDILRKKRPPYYWHARANRAPSRRSR